MARRPGDLQRGLPLHVVPRKTFTSNIETPNHAKRHVVSNHNIKLQSNRCNSLRKEDCLACLLSQKDTKTLGLIMLQTVFCDKTLTIEVSSLFTHFEDSASGRHFAFAHQARKHTLLKSASCFPKQYKTARGYAEMYRLMEANL